VRLQPIAEALECEILQRLVTVLTHKAASPQTTSVSSQNLRASTHSMVEMKDKERLQLFRWVDYRLVIDFATITG